jgi:energy-converting hydrogenase B subunit D
LITWIALVFVVVLLASAVAVLTVENLIGAVAASSVVSLGVSVLFVLMRAPDVAMTEAAVGAGLSGVVLALGLRRLGLWRLEGDRGAAHALVPTGQQERRDA